MPNNPSNQNNPNQHGSDDQRRKDAGKQMGDKDPFLHPRDGERDDQKDQRGKRADKDMGRRGQH